MRPAVTPEARLDAFAADIRHDGDGRLFRRQPRGWLQWLAGLPFSWLAFPLVVWLLRRGLLRLALALGFVIAPALALLLVMADAWSLWRAGRSAGSGLSRG